MVDKVEVKEEEEIPTIRALLRKLAQAYTAEPSKQKLNSTPAWPKEQTPYKAKTKTKGFPTHLRIPICRRLVC